MILGTGIDIIEVDRIQKAIDRWGDFFLKHIFTNKEILCGKNRKNTAQYFASRFAAKEAVYKAISNKPDLGWLDFEILNIVPLDLIIFLITEIISFFVYPTKCHFILIAVLYSI